jgi:DNA-binding NarL/FixJ family response regulator
VADDSAPVRQLLGRLLSGLAQFELIGEACDGCQALEAITELQPDLVILDIRMPGMTGLEVLQALRKQASRSKVIVFSQLGDEAYRTKCFELGAHAFFDKIADFDAFHRALTLELPCQPPTPQ